MFFVKSAEEIIAMAVCLMVGRVITVNNTTRIS